MKEVVFLFSRTLAWDADLAATADPDIIVPFRRIALYTGRNR